MFSLDISEDTPSLKLRRIFYHRVLSVVQRKAHGPATTYSSPGVETSEGAARNGSGPGSTQIPTSISPVPSCPDSSPPCWIVPMPAAPRERVSHRRKIALACEPCRERKSRCDGGKPICASCRRRSFTLEQCIYKADNARTESNDTCVRCPFPLVPYNNIRCAVISEHCTSASGSWNRLATTPALTSLP